MDVSDFDSAEFSKWIEEATKVEIPDAQRRLLKITARNARVYLKLTKFVRRVNPRQLNKKEWKQREKLDASLRNFLNATRDVHEMLSNIESGSLVLSEWCQSTPSLLLRHHHVLRQGRKEEKSKSKTSKTLTRNVVSEEDGDVNEDEATASDEDNEDEDEPTSDKCHPSGHKRKREESEPKTVKSKNVIDQLQERSVAMDVGDFDSVEFSKWIEEASKNEIPDARRRLLKITARNARVYVKLQKFVRSVNPRQLVKKERKQREKLDASLTNFLDATRDVHEVLSNIESGSLVLSEWFQSTPSLLLRHHHVLRQGRKEEKSKSSIPKEDEPASENDPDNKEDEPDPENPENEEDEPDPENEEDEPDHENEEDEPDPENEEDEPDPENPEPDPENEEDEPDHENEEDEPDHENEEDEPVHENEEDEPDPENPENDPDNEEEDEPRRENPHIKVHQRKKKLR